MSEQIKCDQCKGTGMRDRMPRFIVALFAAVFSGFGSFFLAAALFDVEIDSILIDKAERLCLSNKGLLSISTGNRVKCNNNAMFKLTDTDQ